MGSSDSSVHMEIYSLNAYIEKEERSQINNLTFYLREVEKEDQTKPKANKRKEIIKIGTEINTIENRKITEQIKKTKFGSLKRSTKMTNFN